MSAGAIAAIAYGVLALVGGIIGYTKARSKPSLISGVISGLLLIAGGILASMGTPWGLSLATVVAAVLVVVFVIRLIKTRKSMPAALMIVAGVAALAMML